MPGIMLVSDTTAGPTCCEDTKTGAVGSIANDTNRQIIEYPAQIINQRCKHSSICALIQSRSHQSVPHIQAWNFNNTCEAGTEIYHLP